MIESLIECGTPKEPLLPKIVRQEAPKENVVHKLERHRVHVAHP